MGNGKPTGNQLFIAGVTIVLGLVTAAQAWTFTTLMSHGERLGKVETTSIISAEWLKQRLGVIELQLHRIETKQGGPD